MPATPLTAKKITTSLYWSLRSSSDLIIPRYTPRDWWECDLWRLTKSGYVDEYEIKLSLSDFRADAKKEERGRMRFDKATRQWAADPSRNKHDLLANSQEGPNRFWFVVPEDLAAKIELPAWAGLVITTGRSAHIDRSAPKRHARKWEGDRTRLLETFYHRYCNHEYASREDVAPSREPDPV